jgi:hypothetical protein
VGLVDVLLIGRKVLKQTLEADAAYQTLLAWQGATPAIYKTLGAYAHPKVTMPYVTVEHYSGGNENDAQTEASDSLWKIAGHTEDDEELAINIASAIQSALDRKMPVMGDITQYKGYHWIELVYPYIEAFPRQNRIYFKAGGIYRLRLAEVNQG